MAPWEITRDAGLGTGLQFGSWDPLSATWELRLLWGINTAPVNLFLLGTGSLSLRTTGVDGCDSPNFAGPTSLLPAVTNEHIERTEIPNNYRHMSIISTQELATFSQVEYRHRFQKFHSTREAS
ncbi:hypothetical protein MMC13_005898 [Lambiella insularis]|nr:hypothetical protein [Lambiella insularis]